MLGGLTSPPHCHINGIATAHVYRALLPPFLYPQGTVEADVNEDRALMRFEFIEALLRVAITMRDNEGEEEISPAEKV